MPAQTMPIHIHRYIHVRNNKVRCTEQIREDIYTFIHMHMLEIKKAKYMFICILYYT